MNKDSKQMPLRTRILMIMLGLAIVVAAMIYVLHALVIFPGYEELERTEAKTGLNHCLHILQSEAKALDVLLRGWASWDDTHRFAHESFPGYISSNLVKNTFFVNKTNLLYIYNNKREPVWGQLWDGHFDKIVTTRESSITALGKRDILFRHGPDLQKSTFLGIIIIDGKAILLGSRPILTSRNKPPVHGTIMMGRFLTREYIEGLSEASRLNFTAKPIIEKELDKEEKVAIANINVKNPYYITKGKTGNLNAYSVTGISSDKQVLLVKAVIPRTISARGAEISRSFSLTVLCGAILSFLVLLVLLQKAVTNPISKLTWHTVSIRESNDLSLRLNYTRKDELGVLARQIDHMVGELQQIYSGMETEIKRRTAELTETGQKLELEMNRHKEAAESLRRSQEFLSQLFENSPFGIAHLDANNKILSINSAFESIFKYSLEEIQGTNIDELVVPQGMCNEAEDLSSRTFKGETVSCDTRRITKDGNVIDTQVYGIPILLDKERIGIYGIYNDVTREKFIQSEKIRLKDELLEAKKMEAVGTLAGGMAHEFNNLMAVMLGNIDLLLNFGEKKPADLKRLGAIKRNAHRVADLTNQLLSFSRKQMLRLQKLDVNTFIKGSEKSIRQQLPANVQLEMNLTTDTLHIQGDLNQLTQVILDIVQNAGDAMPDGGTITIETKHVLLDEQNTLSIPDSKPGRFACISVTDTGCGIDAETQNHMFEPFFTTKVVGKGTGLGLAVVYGTIKQHGGWLNVSSKVEKGTTIKLYLPKKVS
ncbi:MAG: PAS domain S-box protein [bacterium]|nr:PAS domain S-box protein [bacterium]